MNLGVLAGFTKIRNIASGESYPEMKVVFVPSWFTNEILNANNTDTLLLVDSPSPRTLPIRTQALKNGAAIHVAQWGAEPVTISAEAGVTLRVADGLVAETRGQFSVISLMVVSDETDEWIVFGDLAAA